MVAKSAVDNLPHVSGDNTGADSVDVDLVLPERPSRGLRQSYDSKLAGAVMGKGFISLLSGDRGSVDNLAAAALRDHSFNRFLHADQYAERVDVGHQTPVFLGYVEERFGLGDTGIVEDHVEPSMSPRRLIDHCPHAFPVANIDGDCNRDAAGSLDFLRHRTRAIFRQVGDRQFGTVRCQSTRHFGTDTTTRARYDDAFAFNSGRHAYPPSNGQASKLEMLGIGMKTHYPLGSSDPCRHPAGHSSPGRPVTAPVWICRARNACNCRKSAAA